LTAPEDPHPSRDATDPAANSAADPAADPAGSAAGAPGPRPDDREPEQRAPGLARERTTLAWTRTAIGFAALGGVVLKVNVVTGLIILAMAPLVWQVGRISVSGSPGTDLPPVRRSRIRLITLSIVVVSLLSLLVALLGHAAPGALR
jgi:uncharacterized membrane protein YidH (DUF202 family)